MLAHMMTLEAGLPLCRSATLMQLRLSPYMYSYTPQSCRVSLLQLKLMTSLLGLPCRGTAVHLQRASSPCASSQCCLHVQEHAPPEAAQPQDSPATHRRHKMPSCCC